MTTTESSPPCPGCGLTAPPSGSLPPDHYRASSGCWSRYELLLARSYGEPTLRPVHQLVVDAYTAQHPRVDTPRALRQVMLCLMTLGLFVEEEVDPAKGPRLHQRMVASLPDLEPLAPPSTVVGMTVDDVLAARDAADHVRLAREWADRLWRAWAPHHATVWTLVDETLGARRDRHP